MNGDLAEYTGVAWHDATVPATVTELFLTLPDGEVSRVCHAQHYVTVEVTDSALLARQTRRVVADGARTHLRQQSHRLLTQRPPQTHTGTAAALSADSLINLYK